MLLNIHLIYGVILLISMLSAVYSYSLLLPILDINVNGLFDNYPSFSAISIRVKYLDWSTIPELYINLFRLFYLLFSLNLLIN